MHTQPVVLSPPHHSGVWGRAARAVLRSSCSWGGEVRALQLHTGRNSGLRVGRGKTETSEVVADLETAGRDPLLALCQYEK